MAGFRELVSGLRRAEQQLERQLAGIRSAISSLEFGGAVSPGMPPGRKRGPGRPKGSVPGRRKRRKMSAKARKAISDAQKARWAKLKAKAMK